MKNPAFAAEFSVICSEVPTGELEIVWTNSIISIGDFDGQGSRYYLVHIDESSVTLRNGLGVSVVFRENQLIYDGAVETEKCDLSVLSTDIPSEDQFYDGNLLMRIENLERRILALEK